MLSESFKIVYFVGVLASLLGISAANCTLSDPACDDKVEGGHLLQPPNYKIKNITNSSTSAGQSIFYNANKNLYYVDINADQILRYNYEEKKVYKAKVKGENLVGFIIQIKDKSNQFVVGCGLRVLMVEWDGYSDIAFPIDTLFEAGLQNDTNSDRFIYGKCDYDGRLFAGTANKNFVYDNNKLNFFLEYERPSKSVVWDYFNRKIYYIDTHDSNIKGFPYDFETGITDFSQEKVVMDLYKTNSSEHIIPYDMAIDNDGNIYVATVNDGRIYVINPETAQNKVLYTIKLNCSEVTSVAFGGPNFDILYVTTGKGGDYTPPCCSVFEIAGLGSQGFLSRPAVITAKRRIKIREIPNSSTSGGQSPYWDHQTNNLYYVDTNAGQILRYDYLENTVYRATVGEYNLLSFIIPVEGKANQFAVGSGRRVFIIEWDGVSKNVTTLSLATSVNTYDNQFLNNKPFNDGKCDDYGRLFVSAGSFAGFAWNNNKKKVYFSDTLDFKVKMYYYNLQTGAMDFELLRVVMDFNRINRSTHIIPRGMTIDRDGNIYVATVNEGRIYVISPETGQNQVLYSIKLRCAHVTSAVFGGPNLDILFVTTAKADGHPAPCGSVFKITGLRSRGYILSKVKFT